MSVRGRAEPRTIIIPCIFIELSSLNHFFLHNGCLSGPYLWKYLRDWNKTWFVDRWQWEKELCTITIILPFIFTELSPINHLLFHNGRMPVGPYLWNYKRDWNETWFIDRLQWEEVLCTRTILIPCIFTELFPLNFVFVIIDACLSNILESTKGIEMKPDL